ncbi:olfactory receptor 9G9-like [Rhea pennata]|uniref:olfactory receptor 9G9-like n=1 Tax=Rhea pennata TaxID=8795 RepID=UPI002E25947A
MEKEKGNNCTSSSEFLLLGMGNIPSLHTPLFLLLLLIYSVTVVGNSLIVVLVVADRHLHVMDQHPSSECFLLASMSYDRYLAIRQPLLYASLMTWKVCLLMAAGLKFCGPAATDNFFSDFTPLLELACTDTSVVKIVTFILTLLDSVFPFLITLASYVSIIIAILRIPSSMGRQKAFSTCSSNLTVVTVFYGSLIIVHMLPRTPRLRQLNKVFSFFLPCPHAPCQSPHLQSAEQGAQEGPEESTQERFGWYLEVMPVEMVTDNFQLVQSKALPTAGPL